MIPCKKCGKEFDDSKPEENKLFELHHLIPKCIGGTDKDGRRYLCSICHHKIMGYTLKFMFNIYVKNKEECKEGIKNMTLRWLGEK